MLKETPINKYNRTKRIVSNAGRGLLILILLRLIFASFFTSLYSNTIHRDVKTDTLSNIELLVQMKIECDSSCPEKIDSITTFENTSINGSDTFQYNYRLDIDRRKYNVRILKKNLSQKVYSDWINTPKFDPLRSRALTIVYSYEDKSGTFWFNETFAPSNNYNPQ